MKARRAAGVVAMAVAAALGAGGVAHAAPASKDTDGAVRAMRRQYGFVNAGQWDLEYRELHPAQQALLTSGEFVACSEAQFEPGASVEVGKIRRTYRTTAEIPGTGVEARQVAITYTAEGRDSAASEPVEVTTTSHEVRVRGHWRWVMRADTFRDCLDQADDGAGS